MVSIFGQQSSALCVPNNYKGKFNRGIKYLIFSDLKLMLQRVPSNCSNFYLSFIPMVITFKKPIIKSGDAVI